MSGIDIFGKSKPVRDRPKNSFQAELDAKMKERKAKGLSAELTETEEEDEALGSDDGKPSLSYPLAT